MEPAVDTLKQTPDPGELLARARAMAPVLRERASEAREARRVPAETIAEFKAAGFFRMMQPQRYGGFEMSPRHFYDVVFEIARACPSSGWVLSVVGVHNWQLALLDDRAQQDVWGSDQDALISSSYAPKGVVEKVDGGYRFSGRWQFSSGSDHCDWIFVGGIIPPEPGDEEPPAITSFLLPRDDYEIVDDWYTTGLQGSGSKSLVVENAFVPEYRTHSFRDGYLCVGPGQAVNGSPIYRLPFGQVFIRAVSMPAVGAAQGALDAYCDYNSERLNSVGMQAKEFPASQEAGARALSTIHTAQLKMRHAYETLLGHVERDEAFADIERAEFSYDASRSVDECVTAVQQLLANSGGGAIYVGNRVNEIFQDMLAFRQHAANQPDAAGKNVGAVLFGQPNASFFS
jgi:3-hydroxy-9,10-secoandrosta-1,3,5(10)-triene-9,17-dione monooxygenase